VWWVRSSSSLRLPKNGVEWLPRQLGLISLAGNNLQHFPQPETTGPTFRDPCWNFTFWLILLLFR